MKAGLVFSNSCPSNLGHCTALTTSGQLIGDCSHPYVDKWLGVPYAEPPVGDLRFEDPVAFKRGFRIKTKTQKISAVCPQLGKDYSEDCLYLNIWAPRTKTIKPVLFWIHGGSNYKGGSDDPVTDGTQFAQNEDVIIVSFNYRLGILGYYDNGEKTNFGLKDTIMALKWVKNNIHMFGGDTEKITVFGCSSGGASIRALLSTSQVSGIINNVIIQSDPQNFGFTNRTASIEDISQLSRTLLECSDFECVKNKSTEEILYAEYTLLSSPNLPDSLNKAYLYGPVLDDEILDKDYGLALLDGTLKNKVDAIVGFTDFEAGNIINTLAPSIIPSVSLYQSYMSGFIDHDVIQSLLSENPAFISQLNTTRPDRVREQLVFTGTSYFWTCPIQYNVANSISSSSTNTKTYVYQMTKGITYPSNVGLALCEHAVCHQDDLYLVFGTYATPTTDQRELSANIQRRWANFARYSDPNFSGGAQWLPATSKNSYNLLDIAEGETITGVSLDACHSIDHVPGYSFARYARNS